MPCPAPLRLVGILACGIAWAVTATTAWGKPRVEMELSTDPNFPMTSGQQWYKLLTDRGVAGLQIHQGTGDDKLGIDVSGGKDSPTYRVMGTITRDGTLIVPGGKFTLSDGGAIAKWLRELADNGVEGVTQKKTAFGLTSNQLGKLHEDLARAVTISTMKQPPAQVISSIKSRLTTALTVDAAATQALATEEPVRDELKGLSSGTALAVILRPAGLVLLPQKVSGRDPELVITSGKGVTESWPIGWPAQEGQAKLVPMLFNYLDVEIDDIPASQALDAIEGRLKTPFLYDHNAMARHQVDLAAVKVSIPSKHTYYNRVLQQVLSKAGLQNELRIDEAGKPIFWITTQKK